MIYYEEQSIVTLRNNLAHLIKKVAYSGIRVILTRRGKPIAALVSIEDLKILKKNTEKSNA